MGYLIRSPFDVEALQAGCILPQSNETDFLGFPLGRNVNGHNINPMRPQLEGMTFEEMKIQCDSMRQRDPESDAMIASSSACEISILSFHEPLFCVGGFPKPKQRVSALRVLQKQWKLLTSRFRTFFSPFFPQRCGSADANTAEGQARNYQQP